jgi:hypothetical protein
VGRAAGKAAAAAAAVAVDCWDMTLGSSGALAPAPAVSAAAYVADLCCGRGVHVHLASHPAAAAVGGKVAVGRPGCWNCRPVHCQA